MAKEAPSTNQAAPPANPGRHVLIDALKVADEETFDRLRPTLVARGVSAGTMTDFGVVRVLWFTDPSGHGLELAHWVGASDPSDFDMSTATDAGRAAWSESRWAQRGVRFVSSGSDRSESAPG